MLGDHPLVSPEVLLLQLVDELAHFVDVSKRNLLLRIRILAFLISLCFFFVQDLPTSDVLRKVAVFLGYEVGG